jgi:dimethylaniline monooxygenase (N-oxide forming)
MLHNESKFMKLVDEGKYIHVYRDSIKSLDGKDLTLSSGKTLKSDLVIFATGWKTTHTDMFSDEDLEELGLPIDVGRENDSSKEHWARLAKEAEQDIMTTFPILETAPPVFVHPLETTPFRLYRSIAPPKLAAKGDRSIAFVGTLNNSLNIGSAEVSGLWTAAYLENLLPDKTQAVLCDKDAMEGAVAKLEAFVVKRYRRTDRPIIFVEAQSFIDVLVEDLGCKVERKSDGSVAGYLKETFAPYVCADYKGLTREFLEKSGKSKDD